MKAIINDEIEQVRTTPNDIRNEKLNYAAYTMRLSRNMFYVDGESKLTNPLANLTAVPYTEQWSRSRSRRSSDDRRTSICSS